MGRTVLGVLTGAIVWMAGFYILAILLAMIWHDYALHGRTFFTQGLFTFTPLMASSNLLLWVVAEVGAGWVSTRVAQRREAAWALAGLLEIYLAVMHIALYWPRFPWWYNLVVVVSVVPSVLLGARIAGR